jgi:hypothetical protein
MSLKRERVSNTRAEGEGIGRPERRSAARSSGRGNGRGQSRQLFSSGLHEVVYRLLLRCGFCVNILLPPFSRQLDRMLIDIGNDAVADAPKIAVQVKGVVDDDP